MTSPTNHITAFVAELRRRRVFRIAAFYASSGFVIIQIIEEILEGE